MTRPLTWTPVAVLDGSGAAVGDPLQVEAGRVAARLGLVLRPARSTNPHADPRSYELVTDTGVVLYVLTARVATGGAYRWHVLATLQPSYLDRERAT